MKMVTRTLLLVVLVTVVVIGEDVTSDPKVTFDQGTLVGKVMTSRLGTKFFAFQGVPYAAPPVGPLRFKVRLIFIESREC